MAVGKIVKKDEHEFAAWLKKRQAKAASLLGPMLERMGKKPEDVLTTEIGWLLCLPRFDGKPIRFDAFQARFLTLKSRFRSCLKCRQVGFSFCIACEALARSHLKPRHTAICVSYNLDDAKEKIRLAKELHEDLPLGFQKKMVIDSKTVVGWASNMGGRGRTSKKVSRIISFPSKPPRGQSGDVYLDELAHCLNDKQIYGGATAVVIRSGGQLTMGSTPMGRRGVFHAVHTRENPGDEKKYKGYKRQRVPWWLCSQFSTISGNASLIKFCETLPTDIRVDRFGTERLKEQFDVLPIEDFKQEFELAFQDERVSFFPFELIEPCSTKSWQEIPVYQTVEELVKRANGLGPLYGGFDVGRTKHPSELFIFEERYGVMVERYSEQFRDERFPVQRGRLFKIIRLLGSKMRRFRIDKTGLGFNLCEDLEDEFGTGIVEGVTFTMGVKEELANSLKIRFSERSIMLAKDRGVRAQIHAVKQKFTAVGNSVFDVDRNRFHHGDKAWAIMLAVWRKTDKLERPIEIRTRILGSNGRPARAEQKVIDTEADKKLVIVRKAEERVWIQALDDAALEARMRSTRIAYRVFHRSEDTERAKALDSKYRRLRREQVRRKKAARAQS